MSGHDEDVIGKAYDSRLMKRLLGYLRPYKPQVALALVAIITSAVLQLAPPYLTRLAIDHYIGQRDMAGLPMLAAVYCSVLVGGFLLEYLQTWVMQMTGQRIMFDLRREMYAHLQRLDLRFYDRNPVGRLMTRVTSDVDVLNDLFTAGVVAIFGDVFTLAGIMIVMLGMNWKLALASFVVLPLIVLVTQWFRRNVRESYRVVRGWIARINAFLQENLTGMSTVQLFRREPANFDRFDDDQQGAPRRQHRLDLLLRGVLSRDRDRRRAGGVDHHLARRAGRDVGHADARRARRVPAGTRRASTGRSATCRRSSTSCSRRWPRPSASSRCSTRPSPS